MLKRTAAALATVLTAGALVGAAPTASAATTPAAATTDVPPCPTVTNPPAGSTQIGGTDRYDTAIRTSRSTFTPGVDMVVVATGDSYPDGLAGAAVAANACGPLLLTPTSYLRADVKAELQRLKPRSVLVAGSTGAVSDATVSQIRAAVGTDSTGQPIPVIRDAGANRYETAAKISSDYYVDGAQTVYITSGRGFADAVAAASGAGLSAGPLLLADTTLPASTAAELKRLNSLGLLENVIVLGGSSVVSNPTFDAISSIVGNAADGTPKTVRVAGRDRFGTASSLTQLLWGTSALPAATRAFYVNGLNWPDALAAGPAAAANDAPVLLTLKSCMPAATKTWDNSAASTLVSRVWVGGAGVVSPSTAAC